MRSTELNIVIIITWRLLSRGGGGGEVEVEVGGGGY